MMNNAIRVKVFQMSIALGMGLLSAPLGAVAQPTVQGKVSCFDYIEQQDFELLKFPGLDILKFENFFDAGEEVWFAGKVEGRVTFSGSFSGSSFTFQENGGELQTGECTDLGIFGEGFTLR